MAEIELTIKVYEDVAKRVSNFYEDSASAACRHLAHAIAAALPKPKPQEPTEFGARVLVRNPDGGKPVKAIRYDTKGSTSRPWSTDDVHQGSYTHRWDDLDVIEVLDRG